MSARVHQVQQLREVRLYGHLRARFGRTHWLAVETPAEAVRALCVLFKGFEAAVRDHLGPGFRVLVGNGDRAAWRDDSTLTMGLGGAASMAIVPVVHGRKRNGVGQVILGAVILVAAAFGYGTPQTVQLGIALVLGGAIALLTPMPKGSGSKAKDEVSQQISGPGNVTSAGGPVPLIIGRMLVGSVTISAGLSTDEVTITNSVPADPDLPVDEPQDWIDLGGPGGGGGDA